MAINITRKTAETDISIDLNLYGRGESNISTGVGFLDHMLTLFARHGRFDLCLTCMGDTYIDDHHTTEDIGIVLGKAFATALGDKKGICRYGDALIPMDEALLLCAIDISGRGFLGYSIELPTEKVGSFDTQLVEEFFLAFTRECAMTVHFRQFAGKNSHHIIEGTFKAFARALKQAVAIDKDFAEEVPSTKGVL